MAAPRRLPDDRRESTRDALITAAMSLVGERGAEAMSLHDVAERAGVSKGGLLHHFASKESLVDAVLDRAGEWFERALMAAWDPSAPPFPRLRGALEALSKLGDERALELRVFALLCAQGTCDTRLGSLVRARLDAAERTFADALSLTLAELHAQPRVPVETLGRVLVGALLATTLRPGEAPADLRDARTLWEFALVAAINPFVVEAR